MVVKFKLENKYELREVKIKVEEQSLSELIMRTSKIKWMLDKFMKKSERIIGMEEDK